MRVLKGYGVLLLIGLVVIGFRLTDVPVAIVAALVVLGAIVFVTLWFSTTP
jgi:hypothetical protein